MSFWDGFGLWAQKDPKEQLREWQRTVRQQKRALERSIREIQRDEIKIKKNLQNSAKKGYKDSVKRMAVELVKARKQKEKINGMKEHLNTLMLELRTASAHIRHGRTIENTANLMASMNKLNSYSELQANMMNLSREMEKAGLVQELVDDAIDSSLGDVEDEIDAEVNKVILEVTNGIFESVEPTPTYVPTQKEDVAEAGKSILLESLSSGGGDRVAA